MAVHTGVIAPFILNAHSAIVSSNLKMGLVFPPIQTSGYAADIAGFIGGHAYVEEYRIEASQSGVKGASFYDDLYNRIHINPSALALGNLVSSQTRNVLIWNAHLVPKMYNSLVAINNESIEVTEPIIAGTDIGGLEEVQFVFNIGTDGPSTIAANYIFNIGGEILSLDVTGNRVTMMLPKNNWVEPGVVESLEWMTSVIKSYDGSEQRSAGRSKPRRKIKYQYTMNNSQARYMESLLWGWQSRIFAVPVWMDSQTTTVDIIIGDTEILIPTENLSYYEGGLVILSSGYKNFEAVEIAQVLSDRLVLSLPLKTTWPVGTTLVPSNLARTPQSVKLLRKTNTLFTANIEWSCDPVDTDPHVPLVAAPLQHNGLELMTKKPNWSRDLDTEYMVDTDVLDYGTGAIGIVDRTGYPTVIKKHQWLLKTREEITDLRKFLRRREGRLVPFYMSTFNEDIVVTETLGASGSTLTIVDDGYFLFVNAHPGRKHIEVVTTGGTFYREVLGSTDNEDGTLLLSIDSPLGIEFAPHEFKRISFLNACRLFSDKLVIGWKTKEIAVVEINTVALTA